MTQYFILSSDERGPYDSRLLSYSGVIKGSKVILTLRVEVGPDHSRALENLEAIQTAHNAKPVTAKPKAKPAAARQIAKTAPLLALPAPNQGEM